MIIMKYFAIFVLKPLLLLYTKSNIAIEVSPPRNIRVLLIGIGNLDMAILLAGAGWDGRLEGRKLAGGRWNQPAYYCIAPA